MRKGGYFIIFVYAMAVAVLAVCCQCKSRQKTITATATTLDTVRFLTIKEAGALVRATATSNEEKNEVTEIERDTAGKPIKITKRTTVSTNQTTQQHHTDTAKQTSVTTRNEQHGSKSTSIDNNTFGHNSLQQDNKTFFLTVFFLIIAITGLFISVLVKGLNNCYCKR